MLGHLRKTRYNSNVESMRKVVVQNVIFGEYHSQSGEVNASFIVIRLTLIINIPRNRL